MKFQVGDKVIKVKGVYKIGHKAEVIQIDHRGNIRVDWERGVMQDEPTEFWNYSHFQKLTKLDKVLA